MKRAIGLFMALTMVAASLTACNSKDDSAGNADVYRIGAIGPVTGGTAIYGTAVENGAQIAVDEINEAGGINGHKIEFNFQDDENDPEKSINAYNTLKDWGAQMLMGTVTSNPCIAVADKSAEDGMFQITPSGSSPECVVNDNVFQVCFSDPNQGIEAGKYIGENQLAEKVAVIYDSSDSYSSGMAEAFVAESENQPFEVVVSEAFTADSKTDFTVQLQKAKEAGADMIFLPIYYQEAALIIQQADTMGYEPTFCGGDGLDGILEVENFDQSLVENVILLTAFVADAEDDMTKKFVSTYEEKFETKPNQFAADAYDAIYIIKAAIEEGKVATDMDPQEAGDLLKSAITQITVDGLTGSGMTWEAEGTVNKAPRAVKIVDGAYVAM